MAVRQVKELLEPDPEFVSIVDRGAARKGWVALKRDAPDGDELEPEVRKGMLRSLAARMGVLEILKGALGGGSEPADKPDDRPEVNREDVQALVFDKQAADVDDARAWAKENGFAAGEIEETEHVVRLRQFHPEERTGKAEVIQVAPGISAVVIRERVEKVIRHEGDQWVLYTRDGSKVLGRHATREEAVAQEQAIEANKRDLVAKAGEGNIEGLAKHFADEEHPFSACMAEMADAGYDDEKARNICGRVKAILHEGEAQKADFRTAMSELEREVFGALGDEKIVDKSSAVRERVEAFTTRLVALAAKQSDAGDGEADMDLKEIGTKLDAIGTRLGELEKKFETKPAAITPDPAKPEDAKKDDKPADAKPADAPKDEVLERLDEIGTKLDGIGARVTKLEKSAVVRKGQSESTQTPERRGGEGGGFGIFPWDRARKARANEG